MSTTTTIRVSIFLTVILYLSYNIEIVHAQRDFDTTSDNQYKDGSITCGAGGDCTVRCDKTSACQNTQITCRSNLNCAVTCSYTDDYWTSGGDYDSCNSATITCPTTTTNACAITCATDTWRDQRGCNDLNIIWTAGGINTLICDKSCSNVIYPPPVNNITPSTITCDTQEACYGTIITCPLNARCDITCSADDSCRNSVINCPLDSQCNIICSGTDSCHSATINWSSTSDLGSLQCTVGGDECLNVILPPKTTIASDNFADFTVTCDTSYECQRTLIICPTNANCNIVCSALSACNEAVIQCPVNSGICAVTCTANSACKNADIQWIDGLEHSINCAAFDSSCYGIHFRPYDENTPWTMDCSAASNMCKAAIFDCPQNADCTVKCDPISTSISNVCQGAVINGPVNYQLTVMCNQGYACQAAQLHAEYASFFTLDCLVSQTYTCTSQWIWFPENVAGTKMSIIYARDDSFSDAGLSQQPQLFYAINGWADVDIQYDVYKNWNWHSGTMYCNIDYVQLCSFATNAFACGTGDDCDNPILLTTAAPTPPTGAPTAFPTANPSYPSRSPTDLPTVPTQSPSENPTHTPTLQPTINPTDSPTKNPTDSSTKNPTDSTANPSKYPSTSPSKSPTGNTNYPSDTPTKSPTVQPTKTASNILITLPTPSPTNREAGVDDETTQTESEDNNGLKLEKNSFIDSPIFLTVVGCMVGLVLFVIICAIYYRIKKCQQQIKSIKDTFHSYQSERAVSSSPHSCTDVDVVRGIEKGGGARKGSISLQELRYPAGAKAQNKWDTNPYDDGTANYGSYHPNTGALAFKQVSSLSDVMINNMATNVNEMINHAILRGPAVMEHDEGNQGLEQNAYVGSMSSVNGVLMADIVNETRTPQFPGNYNGNVVNTDTDERVEDDEIIIGDDERVTVQ